jgi:hypothetical protein
MGSSSLDGKLSESLRAHPSSEMLEQLALYESSESITSVQTRNSVRREALSAIAALAEQQLEAMLVFREPARGQK